MRQAQTTLVVSTKGQDLYELTSDVAQWARAQDMDCGLLTIFCRHTSASLTIQENADPDVRVDLKNFFSKLVAEDPRLYRHTQEGVDDMPAHIRTVLTDVSLQIPLIEGHLALGTWQGIYLFEHRHAPQRRKVVLHLLGA